VERAAWVTALAAFEGLGAGFRLHHDDGGRRAVGFPLHGLGEQIAVLVGVGDLDDVDIGQGALFADTFVMAAFNLAIGGEGLE
jgi:hypothetical protein